MNDSNMSGDAVLINFNHSYDREIHELRSQNMTANQALNNIALQLGFQSFDNEEVAIAIEALLNAKSIAHSRGDKIDELRSQLESAKAELEITKQKLQEFSEGVLIRDRQISNYILELEDRDRKIQILEDNLNRARSEHLEQLRAIVQMISPLVNSQVGCVNSEARAALMLAIAVIQNNIVKLDPCLSSHDDAWS